MGLFNPELDEPQLSAYCAAVADGRRAHAALKKDGMVLRRPNGRLVPSPWLVVARDAMRAMLAGARAFGLTPLARRRLGLRSR
jgi:P27 family predicted phage terminase small subunit